jgi:hypothetical protein
VRPSSGAVTPFDYEYRVPLIEVATEQSVLAGRRKPRFILPVVDDGPSRRGSTYWSRVQHCGREHLLSNILGWSSLAPNDPLDIGLIWHAALEAFYRCRLQAQKWMLVVDANARSNPDFWTAGEREGTEAAFDILLLFREENGYKDAFAKLEKMLAVYLSTHRMDRWEILAVEYTLDCPDVEYTSKIDLIVIDYGIFDAPLIRTVEHKSAFRLTVDVTEGYHLDSQVMGQVYLGVRLLRVKGLPPYAGACVNICSKESTPKIERVFVAPHLDHLLAWEEHIKIQHEHRTFHETRGYSRNYASCSRRYGRCEHFDFCRFNPSLREPELRSMMPPANKYEIRSHH